MALSTSGTSSPAAIRPRSPPRLAVEGSSDVSFATWAKSAPPRIRASVVSARALAWSSAALPPTARHLDQDVRDLRAGRLLELAPAGLVRRLDVGVGDGRRRHARGRQDRRQDTPALRLGELGGMRLVVGVELGVGRREPLAAADGDQEVARAHAAPVRLPGLSRLGLGDLGPVGDQGLQALPHQLRPEARSRSRPGSSGAGSSRGAGRSGRGRSARPPGTRRCA